MAARDTESLQHTRSLNEGDSREGGGVQSMQVVQGEGCQLGWHTNAEAGLESAEDGCLESEATTAIINLLVS
jgi:hypothetical protein